MALWSTALQWLRSLQTKVQLPSAQIVCDRPTAVSLISISVHGYSDLLAIKEPSTLTYLVDTLLSNIDALVAAQFPGAHYTISWVDSGSVDIALSPTVSVGPSHISNQSMRIVEQLHSRVFPQMQPFGNSVVYYDVAATIGEGEWIKVGPSDAQKPIVIGEVITRAAHLKTILKYLRAHTSKEDFSSIYLLDQDIGCATQPDHFLPLYARRLSLRCEELGSRCGHLLLSPKSCLFSTEPAEIPHLTIKIQ